VRVIGVDTETFGLAWDDFPFLASTHDGVEGRVWELPAEAASLREYLSDKRLVFHNAKFDLQKLILAGVLERALISADRIEDTEGLAHLLDEHQVKKLKHLAKTYLGEDNAEQEEIRKAKKVVAKEQKLKLSEISYDMLPPEVVQPYAIKDAEYTLRLYELFNPQLEQYDDLKQLYADEMELCLVLLDIEAQTMKLDMEYLNAKVREYSSRALRKELEIRDMVGEESFNPNSSKQVLEVFAELGIKLKSTGKIALRGVDHPLSAAILELRHLRKVLSTYLLGLQQEQKNGYIHLNFRQHKPVTGRMSSGGREEE